MVRRSKNLLNEVKKHGRTRPDVQFKEISLTKQKPRPKTDKRVEIKVKLPHVNKKPLARKLIFVHSPFSHSTLRIERKKNHAAKPLAFSLHFLFRRDQNHYSKIMKMCEQS